MVVVFVIIAVFLFTSRGSTSNGSNDAASTTVNATPTDSGPPVVLEAAMAATLTAGTGNPEVQAAETAFAAHTNITPVPNGQLAPDFTLPGNDGKTYTLSDFRGKKPVLLEFMAPWCPHCQKDSTILNQVYNMYKDTNLQMLGVSAHPYGRDWEDKVSENQYTAPLTSKPISMDDLNWFRDTFHVPYPLLLDKQVKAADQYGIAYFPTIYILDKDGKVASMIQSEQGNPITTERIQGELDKVVK
jgi:peroxiredoxin